MTIALSTPRGGIDLARMWRDAPAFTGLAVLIALGMVPLLAALALDDRLFQGDPVWIKPLKFHAALAIYLVSLAFFARFMPQATRDRRLWRGFVAAVCLAVLAELLWIGGAASFQTASHFNVASPVMSALYGLMGAFAVLLTSASLFVGISIWRNPATGLPDALRLSIALGLVATFALTVLVAGYMSSNLSHFVGTSSRSLAIMGWSRDAGDLRVAHFFATHAMHSIPLAGLLAVRFLPGQARRVVIAATVAYSALVLALFAQGLAGLPFLPGFG